MAIRWYTNLEMAFNSVERVVNFTEIDQERPAVTDVRPPRGVSHWLSFLFKMLTFFFCTKWPTKGQIEVQDLDVRYAPDLDLALKGLTFSIRAQEKIGVVGRTGSGKSTLALSLFRFIEATRGTIHIDGVNINDIGTYDLRSNLTIIPQGKRGAC